MNVDRRIQNDTAMYVRAFATEDRHGRDVMLVVAKMTWSVSDRGRACVAEKQVHVRLNDQWSGLSGRRAVRFPSDMVDEKPGTDVLLVGTAHPPPKGDPPTSLEVSLRVETGRRTIGKTLRVYGARHYREGLRGVVPGPAAPLTPTPITWALAYGGTADARNPAGVGNDGRDHRIGQEAPRIEDPSALWSVPAGFGAIAAWWSPRAERAGTQDDRWRRRRAPVRPVDFDPRYNCSAPDDLWSEEPLTGDEPVEVLNATPFGAWRFKLPRYAPVFTSVTRGGAEQRYTSHLDTFLIDADDLEVQLCWRVRIPLPRKTELLEQVRVTTRDALPAEAA